MREAPGALRQKTSRSCLAPCGRSRISHTRLADDAGSLPHAGRIHQHAPGPAVDVKLLHNAAHAAHPGPLLGRRHRQSQMQGGRTLIDVVRIDDQRLGQLSGRAGELAEDQHALLVVSRRDEFFGHEIHAVMQAADDAEVGPSVIGGDVLRIVMFDPQINGLVSLSPESLIDAFGRGDDLLRELLILLNLGAAGSGDLDEGERADPFRLQLQQPFNGKEPLENALRIVQPFDADTDAMRVRESVDRADMCPARRTGGCSLALDWATRWKSGNGSPR